MSHFLNKITIIFMFVIALFICSQGWAAQITKAKQAIILDYETGQVLLDKNSDEKMPTSSMSKVMTAYVVFEALKSGHIQMDTEFTVSKKASEKEGSKMFIAEGSKVKVEDLLRGVIIQSGNDATIALAEGMAPSEEDFATRLTARAHEMGMAHSNFVNASGWPDPDHYSTARDLSVLATHLIKGFPEYYKIYSETEFTFSNIKQANRNPLLYKNIGADGIKTGHTEIGGYGLIGSAVKDGRRVIMVVNGLESEKDRADESARLMEWALNSFSNKTLLAKGDVVAMADIAMGKEKSVTMIVDKDIYVTVPKYPVDSYGVDVRYNAPLIAPIKAGSEIGTMTVVIPEAENQTYKLYAGHDVAKLGFFSAVVEKIKYRLFGKL